jgi:hypothetical protein
VLIFKSYDQRTYGPTRALGFARKKNISYNETPMRGISMSKFSARDKLYVNGVAKFVAVYAATFAAIYVAEKLYANAHSDKN